MKINKNRLKQKADRVAATYDEVAVVPRKMAHRMMDTLQEMNIRPARILELGCATGYLTQLILDRFPEARVVATDFSGAMLSVARDKVEPSTRVRFLEADAESDDLGECGPFDLIVSTGLLHWLSDPEAAMRKWTGWLAPEGWIICSAFGIDTVMELREVVKQVEADHGIHRPEPALYRSAGEWEEVVRRCGLTKTGSRECWHLLEFPDCRSILATIRGMGESGFVRPLPFGLDRIVVTEVMRRYNLRYRRRRQVYATCHLLQVYGRKPGREHLREVTAPHV